MTKIDENPDDVEFAKLLADLDDGLMAGDIVDTKLMVEDQAVRNRLHEAQPCLELLHSVWPKRIDLSSFFASTSPESPHFIGRFEIERELGRGGQGVVFLAFDPSLQRKVALKVPRPEHLASKSMRERFRQEAQLAARLDHPNLVAIHEVDVTGPVNYLVTAYCPGPSLAVWLRAQPALATPLQTARLLLPLTEAVAFMHAQGVLHRDIKPGNILLDTSLASAEDLQPGVPKLTDFGLAALSDANIRNTLSGSLIGTLAYMPPEQVEFRSGAIGPQQDVYSLGVVLYECLIGKPPFQGATEADTIRQLLNDEPVPPHRLRQSVPRDLEVICLKCLEKDPGRRYASAAALAEDLRSFVHGQPIKARPVNLAEKTLKWVRRHPTVTAMMGVTTMTAVCLIVLAIWHMAALQKHGRELDATLAERNAALIRAESVESQLIAENYAVQIKIAESMHDEDGLGSLYGLLDDLKPKSGREDHRGFEWYYLRNIAARERSFRGHRRPVRTVAISPDGQKIASVSMDGIVYIWDSASGKPSPPIDIAEWSNSTVFNVNVSLAFTRDGNQLATSASDTPGLRSLIVWDVDSRKKITQFSDDKCLQISGVFTSPIEDVVGFLGNHAGDNVHLGLWNWRSGEVKYFLLGPEKARWITSLSPDGKTLIATSAYDHKTLVWDMPSGTSRLSIQDELSKAMTATWSADSSQLATSLHDNIVIWDIASGSRRSFSPENELPIWTMAFQPAGTVIAFSHFPSKEKPLTNTLRLFDLKTAGLRAELLNPGCGIHGIAWTPNGQAIAAGCEDHQVRLWSPFSAPAKSIVSVGGAKEAWALAFSPDSETLAVGYDDEAGGDRETLKLWNVRSGQEICDLDGHSAMVTGVAFSPEGDRLYSAGYDKMIKVWDLKTNTFNTDLGQHATEIKSLAISRDGQMIASAGTDWSVKLWDTSTQKERFVLSGHEGIVHTAVFDPAGKLLASSDNTSEVRIWNVQTGQLVRLINDTVEVLALAFSPSGDQLATANEDGLISLYDMTSETVPKCFSGHKGQAAAIAYAPDGKTLATGGADGKVRLWHVGTGRELFSFNGLSARVNRIAFSANGQHLAAALIDGNVCIWHALPAEE